MNKVIMKKWVKALKSGSYKQATGTLCSIDGKGVKRHCCLGVLTELYLAERRRNKKSIGFSIKKPSYTNSAVRKGEKELWSINGESGSLPRPVAKWAGFNMKHNEWSFGEVEPASFSFPVITLATLNDGCTVANRKKKNFKQIAKIIEKNWEYI